MILLTIADDGLESLMRDYSTQHCMSKYLDGGKPGAVGL